MRALKVPERPREPTPHARYLLDKLLFRTTTRVGSRFDAHLFRSVSTSRNFGVEGETRCFPPLPRARRNPREGEGLHVFSHRPPPYPRAVEKKTFVMGMTSKCVCTTIRPGLS